MSWEQRFREMVLAGGAGALLAVGCTTADGVKGSDANSNIDSNIDFCCNANSDPCCRSLYCGETVTAECTVKMACESDGGTWDFARRTCGREDSGPGDASFDALIDSAPSDVMTIPDVSFCCNVNPDPCCPSLQCGATVTPQCTEKMACESDGGTWDFGTCSRDSGTREASSD